MWDDRAKGYRKRRKSINAPYHAHELTFSCYRRLPLLSSDRTRCWMADAINMARDRHDVDVIAYVIMPDHLHVIVRPRCETYDISVILRTMKRSVARRALRWLRQNDSAWLNNLKGERAGDRVRYHFWQPGGGYDRNVIKSETLASMVEYLHMNPVRRGLVNAAVDWYWSSARWYEGDQDGPITIDALSSVWH